MKLSDFRTYPDLSGPIRTYPDQKEYFSQNTPASRNLGIATLAFDVRLPGCFCTSARPQPLMTMDRELTGPTES